jgi:hypothetical protein
MIVRICDDELLPVLAASGWIAHWERAMSNDTSSTESGRQRPTPDLADAFIILLLAAALDIFVFWLASQAVGNPVFDKLPSFITDALPESGQAPRPASPESAWHWVGYVPGQ